MVNNMNKSRIFLIAIKRQFRLSNIITFGVLALLMILTNIFVDRGMNFERIIVSSIRSAFLPILIVRLIFVLKETNNHGVNKAIYLNYNSKSIYISRILSDFLLMLFGLLLITTTPILIHVIKNHLYVSGDDVGKWVMFILGYSVIYMLITVLFRYIQASIKNKGLRAIAYTTTIILTYTFMLIIKVLMGLRATVWEYDFQTWIYENREIVTWVPILNITTVNLVLDHTQRFTNGTELISHYEYWRMIPFIIYSLGVVSLIATLGASKRKTLLCA